MGEAAGAASDNDEPRVVNPEKENPLRRISILMGAALACLMIIASSAQAVTAPGYFESTKNPTTLTGSNGSPGSVPGAVCYEPAFTGTLPEGSGSFVTTSVASSTCFSEGYVLKSNGCNLRFNLPKEPQKYVSKGTFDIVGPCTGFTVGPNVIPPQTGLVAEFSNDGSGFRIYPNSTNVKYWKSGNPSVVYSDGKWAAGGYWSVSGGAASVKVTGIMGQQVDLAAQTSPTPDFKASIGGVTVQNGTVLSDKIGQLKTTLTGLGTMTCAQGTSEWAPLWGSELWFKPTYGGCLMGGIFPVTMSTNTCYNVFQLDPALPPGPTGFGINCAEGFGVEADVYALASEGGGLRCHISFPTQDLTTGVSYVNEAQGTGEGWVRTKINTKALKYTTSGPKCGSSGAGSFSNGKVEGELKFTAFATS